MSNTDNNNFITTIQYLNKLNNKLITNRLYLYIRNTTGYKFSLLNLSDNYLNNYNDLVNLTTSIYNNNIPEKFLTNYNIDNLTNDYYKKLDSDNKILFEINLIIKFFEIVDNSKYYNTFSILCEKLNIDIKKDFYIQVNNIIEKDIESIIEFNNNYHFNKRTYYCNII